MHKWPSLVLILWRKLVARRERFLCTLLCLLLLTLTFGPTADGYSVSAFLQAIEDQAKEVQATDVGASGGEETKEGEKTGGDDKETKHDKMEQG
jgi:hypothetical protein